MARSTAQQHSLHDLCRTMFRHKKKVVSFFVGVMVLVVLATIVWPRKYKSEAKMFVRVGKTTVQLDPTVTGGNTMSVNDARESEINSVIELLGCRGMVEKVVDHLGTDFIMQEDAAEEEIASQSASGPAEENSVQSAVKENWRNYTEIDAVSKREKAINQLQKRIKIWASKKSSVISISCTAESPKLAQKIVSTWLDIYAGEHLRVNRTAGSFDFFNEQTLVLKQGLQEATDALRNAKNEVGLISVEGQRTNLQHQVDTIEEKIQLVTATLDAGRARVASLISSRDIMPERLTTTEVDGLAHAASDNMRGQLYTLEIRHSELLKKYTEEHPFVIALGRQVKDARDILKEQDKQRTQSTETLNPVRQKVRQDLAHEASLVASLTAELKAWEGQYVEVQKKLRLLNNNEVRIATLERLVARHEANYISNAEKLEQARVNQALENGHITNVNVAQAATLVEKPVSPKTGLILALGMMVAICGSVGVALGSEHLDPTLKTPWEIEEQLAVPVFITLRHTTRRRANLYQEVLR